MQTIRTLTLIFSNNTYSFNVLPKTIEELATKSFSKTSKKIKKFFYTTDSGQRVNLVTDQDLEVFYATFKDKQLTIEGKLGDSDLGEKEQKFDIRSWMEWMKQKAPSVDSEFLNLMENPDRFPCEDCLGLGSLGKRECGNCYGTGSRPIKSMWKLLMKVIDYKIHFHLFTNISNFLDMWQKTEKEKTSKIEQQPTISKLQDNLSYKKNWSSGPINQFATRDKGFQDPFAPTRPKTPQQRTAVPSNNLPITSSLPTEIPFGLGQPNYRMSLAANSNTSLLSGNFEALGRYEPTTKFQHYNAPQHTDSFLTSQNGKQDSSLNEVSTYTQKKIEYAVLNDHKDFVIIKSNRTFTLRLQNKNDFDWDYSLVLEIQGVINKSIKLNKKIHPGETLSLTISDLEESTKDGQIVLCFKGKDELEKIKYYSERFNDFNIRFV